MDFGDDRWWESNRFWAKAVVVCGVIACGAQAAAMVGMLAKEPAKNLENANKAVIEEALKINQKNISKAQQFLLYKDIKDMCR